MSNLFKNNVKVVSLFDGMACGLTALKRAGIKVSEYHAFEIDKYAIEIAKKNHPEIIHHGSVVDFPFFVFWGADLLIGGSPCQGFSFAGKQLAFNDSRSALFFEYVRALGEISPRNFLLENVRMKKEYLDVISKYVGVEPVLINSALVSAQNRKRYYWCNWEVEQPEDKGILLKDIIEGGANKIARIVGRKINPTTGKRDDYNIEIPTAQRLEIRPDNKSGTLTTVQKDNVVVDRDKKICLDANYHKGGNLKNYFEKSRRQLVFDNSCLHLKPYKTNNYIQFDSSGKGYESQNDRAYLTNKKFGSFPCSRAASKIKVTDGCGTYRKLTPIECERLQTLPDNYTEGVSNTQRYRMIGNGWTVDVVQHIFKQNEELV